MAIELHVVRKGMFCGIAESHSAVYLRGPAAAKHTTYTIGKVAKADRLGSRIKEALVVRYGTEIRLREDMQPRFWSAMTIRGDARQAQAAALYGREFASVEEMRAAFG